MFVVALQKYVTSDDTIFVYNVKQRNPNKMYIYYCI